jgi:maleylpyruvate isomerase
VLRYLEQALKLDQPARDSWYRHWIGQGFQAMERMLRDSPPGPYCHGALVTLADLCLVPQMFNARRFEVDLSPYGRLCAIDAACRDLPAFRDTAPAPPP